MKDQKTKDRFVELRAQGLSYAKIADELGVCKQTLIAWSKEHRSEIDNLKSIELEALQERYYLTTKTRIELFGRKLQEILDELAKRDLSDVPTVKLFGLMERFARVLQDEAVPVTFTQQMGLEDYMQQMNTTADTWGG